MARAPARTRDGPSAVHVAMSNTLNTPVEALELAYPLRVERYALRLGSGGKGRFWAATASSGRSLRSSRCRVSIVSERRAHGPAGLAGGEPGSPGRNLVDGEEFPAKVTRALDGRRVGHDRDARRRWVRRPPAGRSDTSAG